MPSMEAIWVCQDQLRAVFAFGTAANLAARLIRWLFALEQGGISTGSFFLNRADEMQMRRPDATASRHRPEHT
jgi:hypothetical protein